MPIRFVYFDCMETLIQMDIPSMDIYPLWAYEVAEQSGHWESLADFHAAWVQHRHVMLDERGSLKEFTLFERLHYLVNEVSSIENSNPSLIEQEVQRIKAGYWQRYLAASYPTEGLSEVLIHLKQELNLPLGIVSNFIVPGGVGDLLRLHNLQDHFQVVVNSSDIGWKKPSEQIYQFAIQACGFKPDEILFVGDNPMADYDGPRLVGIQPVLFDPNDEHTSYERRIRDMGELKKFL